MGGVAPTPATIEGGLVRGVVAQWADGAEVIAQPCPGLAELVEAGVPDEREADALLERYLAPLVAARADVVVLGCTHYPYLLPRIQRLVGPGITVIDAAPAVAAQARRVLDERGLRRSDQGRVGRTIYATTGDPARFAELLARLPLPPGEIVAARV
nr:MAG: hypothetical protein DIU80_19375 [Chloroflexota bacterium]